MLNECNGCEYKCSLSHIAICTLGSPCPHQRSTPMTNEEWLHTLNTEQLAEFISKIDMPFMDKAPFPCGDLIECNKNCGLYSRCVKDDFPTNKEVWVEWLKQPNLTSK